MSEGAVWQHAKKPKLEASEVTLEPEYKLALDLN